jgi:uncharacterized protein YegP (UPF0339 family)
MVIVLFHSFARAEKHRFRFKAANNQIIGVGEAYESEANLKNGIVLRARKCYK